MENNDGRTARDLAEGSDRAIKALNGEEPDFYIYEGRMILLSFGTSLSATSRLEVILLTNHTLSIRAVLSSVQAGALGSPWKNRGPNSS